MIQTLQESNAANHKELDWQGQYEALNDGRRIVMHHPETLRPYLHEFMLAAVPAIDQLRSFTSRNAMILFQVSSQMRAAFDLIDHSSANSIHLVSDPVLSPSTGKGSQCGQESKQALQQIWVGPPQQACTTMSR